MDRHGGRTSLPQAHHRPRAPIMSVPTPQTAPLAPLRPPPSVTLAAPRPETERATNEYVETPIRPALVAAAAPPPPPPPPEPPRSQRPARLAILPPPPAPAAVTKQPSSFAKDVECLARPSIMCPDCGRCRCDSCQQPRPLPSRWLCDNHCFCSADAAIDYVTCLCCVKGLFYHCSDADGAGASCADDPCGCGPDRRTARWGCLAALSCVLPCLWCYWPLQCGKRAVEACYARHSRQGCRCGQPRGAAGAGNAAAATPEKRLLDATPDL